MKVKITDKTSLKTDLKLSELRPGTLFKTQACGDAIFVKINISPSQAVLHYKHESPANGLAIWLHSGQLATWSCPEAERVELVSNVLEISN